MLHCCSYAYPAESIDVRCFVSIPAWIHHEASRGSRNQGKTIAVVLSNRKLHTGSWLLPKSMTLDNLERPLSSTDQVKYMRLSDLTWKIWMLHRILLATARLSFYNRLSTIQLSWSLWPIVTSDVNKSVSSLCILLNLNSLIFISG